jgi:hypothetical protein
MPRLALVRRSGLGDASSPPWVEGQSSGAPPVLYYADNSGAGGVSFFFDAAGNVYDSGGHSAAGWLTPDAVAALLAAFPTPYAFPTRDEVTTLATNTAGAVVSTVAGGLTSPTPAATLSCGCSAGTPIPVWWLIAGFALLVLL